VNGFGGALRGQKRPKRKPQKINFTAWELISKILHNINNFGKYNQVRLMFQDEAGFGRVSKPKYCWCYKGLRPVVPSHHIREYRYTYGAIEPLTDDSFFWYCLIQM